MLCCDVDIVKYSDTASATGSAEAGHFAIHWLYQAVPHVTAHPSTTSVPITVLLYNGSLLCSFNKPFKVLTETCSS